MGDPRQDYQEWNVYVSNPPDFLSWSSRKKLQFYERGVAWHDYIADLQEQGFVSTAWGTEKILGSGLSPVTTKTMYVARYTASVNDFNRLITEDPLWDFGAYYAPMLKSIEGDYEDDLARYHRVRGRLEAKLGRELPEPQLKFADPIPEIQPGGSLQFLVTMTNGPGYADLTDEERLSIDERVLQFHDYHQQLRERRVIVDDGACFPIWGYNMVKDVRGMCGYTIFEVNSYDEFSDVLLPNPLLLVMSHMTVALVPFEKSRRRAERELKTARGRLR
jgi:hypothetical protein